MFRASLARTPNRPLSLRGLARAQAAAGDARGARDSWTRLLEIREGHDGAPGVAEARRALAAADDAAVAASAPAPAAAAPAHRPSSPAGKGAHDHH
jgi:hypothetical protein